MKTVWLALGVAGVYGGTVAPAVLLPWLDQIVGHDPLNIAVATVSWVIATVAVSSIGFIRAGY